MGNGKLAPAPLSCPSAETATAIASTAVIANVAVRVFFMLLPLLLVPNTNFGHNWKHSKSRGGKARPPEASPDAEHVWLASPAGSGRKPEGMRNKRPAVRFKNGHAVRADSAQG